MARDILQIRLELDRINCHDEGDGWGNAEPYLWTVFFKVDGSTVRVTNSLTLAGEATIHTTPGSHGNLGTTDVDEGDTVTIPAAIGHWETYLAPIPVPESLSTLADDIGGIVGVVAVLVEEDNVTDDGAEAGHQALNNAVRDAVNQIIATRSFTNPDVTDAEIDAFTSTIQSTVTDAIRNQQNFFEDLWSWLNPDDTIGFKVWLFKQDDLADGGTVDFAQRWKNEGDWEIFGHITSTVLCPADALDRLFGGRSAARMLSVTSSFASRSVINPDANEDDVTDELYNTGAKKSVKNDGLIFDLKTLREFRDGQYRQYPGLANWWKLAERNTPALVNGLLKHKELRESARQLMKYAPKLVQNLDTEIADEQLENAARLLTGLKQIPGNRRLSIDCSRALTVLPILRGKTGRDALKLLSSIQPARHPSVSNEPEMRISKPVEVSAYEVRKRKRAQ